MNNALNGPIRIEGALEVGGRPFPFYLECRNVNLGSDVEVQLYSMPSAQLRGPDPNLHISNFRSCIGYWYARMQERGLGSDWVQQSNLVLATSYALVRRDKGPQKIVRDALLRAGGVRPGQLTLSDDLRDRIQRAIESRDLCVIRQEFETALEAHQLSREDTVGITAALDAWVGQGIGCFQAEGLIGLRGWLTEIARWIRKFRKRSEPRVRLFLNCFAYEAKASFYLCYANFWIGLIPWLKDQYNLDPLSERFLRLWHNQNQPHEIPHGHSSSTLVYPPRTGQEKMAPQIEVIPDVFFGQVLALHPLTAILLSRRELRECVGAFISSPQYEQAKRSGTIGQFSEYWKMVEAVLTAAYLYQEARLQYESERSEAPLSPRTFVDEGQTLDPSRTPTTLLSEYVNARKSTCPCGGNYNFVSVDLPTSNSDEVSIPVECDSCRLPSSIVATAPSLAAFLRPDADR